MSATKIGGNKNIVNCFFFQNKFIIWSLKLNVYIWKTEFTSHNQCLFGLLFSKNAKKTHPNQII